MNATKKYNQVTWALINFISGTLIMLLSSVLWIRFPEVYKATSEYNITVGEIIQASGQTAGQMLIIFCVINLVKLLREEYPVLQYLFIVAWFLFILGAYDLVDIFFLNPFEVSVSKFFGFVVAVIITVIRLTTFKNGRTR